MAKKRTKTAVMKICDDAAKTRGALLSCRRLYSLRNHLFVCAWLISTATAAQSSHTVQPGETLWGISGQRLETPLRWPEVQQRNHVGEPRSLQPGKVLYFADGNVASEGTAVVTAVEGQASRRRAGSAEQMLTPGMPIQPGDTVVTGSEAFVTLGLPGGSRVVLPSRSAVEVQAVDASTVRLRLIEGRVESQVEKQQPGQQFEIRARSLGLGVRGTHFRVRDEEGLLTGEVIEGEVVVSQNAAGAQGQTPIAPPLVLRAGNGAVLLGNGSAETHELLAAPRLVPTTAPRSGNRTLQLVPVDGAETYRLQLARDERFLMPVHEQRSTGPSFVVPSELEAGLYQLRLTAFDNHQLEGLPGDSTLYLPEPTTGGRESSNTVPMVDGRVEIRWPGVSGRRYAFELSSRPDFSLILISEPAVYATGLMIGPLPISGRYYWHVHQVGNDVDAADSLGFNGSFDIPAR